MKHTKGPWTFNSENTCLVGPKAKIFDVRTGVEPSKSDAQLIAAAPEMLFMLTKLRDEAQAGLEKIDAENLRLIELIIAKAEGK